MNDVDEEVDMKGEKGDGKCVDMNQKKYDGSDE